MSNEFNIPVILIIYNRSKYLENILSKLKIIKPKKIYISADGPKNYLDIKKCETTRKFIEKNITWNCIVKKNYKLTNIGLKRNINEGLDWLFSNESCGIILEDDCDPSNSFFRFCEQLLKKYMSEEKIKMISGNFYYENELLNKNKKNSYFFSQRPGTHGWATWKRAWLQNDKDMKDWNKFFDFFWLLKYFKFNLTKTHYFYKKFHLSSIGLINSWDYQWLYSIFRNNGLIIRPFKHLCKHIGWGDDATHGKGKDTFSNLIKKEISFPIIHPTKIKVNYFLDNLEDINLRKLRFINYFYYKIINNLFMKKIRILIK